MSTSRGALYAFNLGNIVPLKKVLLFQEENNKALIDFKITECLRYVVIAIGDGDILILRLDLKSQNNLIFERVKVSDIKLLSTYVV